MAIPLSLIPVNLKESALDSPTFRANAIHFCEQVEAFEKWIEGYIRSTQKLCQEIGDLEESITTNFSQSVPTLISESILDHDYSFLATELLAEAAKEFWGIAIAYSKRIQPQMIDPLLEYLRNDVRQFKDCRRAFETSQQRYDMLLQRYAGQSKSKEASALREDAFQLHESRKIYIRSSFDFCIKAPELRASLDRVITRVTTDLWREQVKHRRCFSLSVDRYEPKMDRIRSWSDAMETSAAIFKHELALARRDMEEQAKSVSKPSRELEDYSTSTVPFLTTRGKESAASLMREAETIEKQGWLFIRSATGKPGARSTWFRRWCFVKDGIFGCLVQGPRGSSVEETEKIGLLLCNVKPAFQEDRRFCFEIKTKDTSMLLQAETQQDLSLWLSVFESAKRAAVLSSSSPATNMSAFAISPPSAEFASGQMLGLDETDKQSGLGALNLDPNSRISTDLGKRPMLPGDDMSSGVHGSRLGQILELPNRKTPALGANQPVGGDRKSLSGAGIQALLSAGHGAGPLNTAPPAMSTLGSPGPGTARGLVTADVYASPSLAPRTLVNLPMSTSLSRHAVAVSTVSECGMTTPGGLMANSWGTSNWAISSYLDDNNPPETGVLREKPATQTSGPAGASHRKTMSLDLEVQTQSAAPNQPPSKMDPYPSNYPDELHQQDGQFRILFPGVPREEVVLLVFRATWKPNDAQEFPGRAFVTTNALYFYSHYLGLVLTNKIRLQYITSVQATSSKASDTLQLHLKEVEELGPLSDEDIFVTTFLESVWLLQRRLRYLVDLAALEAPVLLSDVIDNLMRMDNEPQQSPTSESWEEISMGEELEEPRQRTTQLSLAPNSMRRLVEKATGLETGSPLQRGVAANPVTFAPPANTVKIFGETFPLSAKSLFSLIFGERSRIFHDLYSKRRSDRLVCGPWVRYEKGIGRREFQYTNVHGQFFHGQDFQTIKALEDNRYYVVVDSKHPWMIPNSDALALETTIVIAQVTKSSANLSLWGMVRLTKGMSIWRDAISRHASQILREDAQDLVSIITDEVNKTGHASKPFKIISQYGTVILVDEAKSTEEVQAVPYAPPASVMPEATYTSLVVNDCLAVCGKGARKFGEGLLYLLGQVWGFLRLNSVLLAALGISILLNVVVSSKTMKDLWHDRAALRYIESIGVLPASTMRRSITLDEIDMAATFKPMGFQLDENQCFQKFLSLSRLADDERLERTEETSRQGQSLSRKLELTRRKLGVYRHDLLVTLSLVNRLETDVLLSEWESWVYRENLRCRHAMNALQNATRISGQEVGNRSVSVSSYCRSCETGVSTIREHDGGRWMR
ncbi:hypothetical protein DRE_01388 [Drechslerella stenobrocha 248]|uniref:Uncharacterized protein n=1 Tax=Drechslerella stenobrocha 248 TaxID=1043628 RepID=W7HJE1_9PEZI|nr:hypothetical protein DRE_01388 [Drechslerella stenobrocha 248]